MKGAQASHQKAIVRAVKRGERVEDPSDAPYALAWSAYLQRMAAPRTWRWIWVLNAVLVLGWAVQMIAALTGNHRVRDGWVGAVVFVSVFVVAPICTFLFLQVLARRAARADTENRRLLRQLEEGWRMPGDQAS